MLQRLDKMLTVAALVTGSFGSNSF